MGITYAEIELIRGADLVLAEEGYLSADDIRRLKVLALVDTGSSMLVISRSLSKQLALRHVDEVDTELANGTLMRADVVGPVEVRFQNRKTVVNAVVVEADTDVLLGAIPIQGMDVMVDPKRERLILNPDSPDKARMLMK
ncbi:MAG: retroviral-like aspartic protease [Leptolyngbya sp. RL_3_1]|nr:retroviral-like aspartic protease [Leptolyngbya sp. RL_3_1]